MRKYYFANLYEAANGGGLVLTGSKIVSIWFWQTPVVAYKNLGRSGKIPVGMRRIR